MEYNESLNMFTKGIVADLDPLMVGQDQWVFPTLNIRVMNKEGQGIIATVVEGNDFEYSLTSGFLALGCCEYNGVCYIASYSQGTGEGEIGCFPSPLDIDEFLYPLPYSLPGLPAVPKFERKYRPFLNYVAGVITPDPLTAFRIPLRDTAFNFDIEHQISMFAKESYDGSVDLYLADYKNFNRVINSNFNQLGRALDRLYFVNDFTSSMYQIQISNTILGVTLDSISDGGQLEYGIYFVHFRYCDANHNTTHFITTSNACQVFDGNIDPLNSTEGGNASQVSQKKLNFTLNNVDTSFVYVNVAVTRWYSNVQGIMIHDSWLCNNDFTIGGPILSIQITGQEPRLSIDDAEIIKGPANLSEFICRDHIHINNRYYGGNWKGILKHHQSLIDDH